MKILYVTTIGLTMTFFKQLIRELLDEGHTVDIMCNENDKKVPGCYREWNCKVYHHSCSRSPLSLGNLKAIKQIEKIVNEKKYEVVHCHTPVAAMCTRVACKGLRKQGVKIMYTAHGFHFYKGAPMLNWLIFYPIEKICSYWTDVLITINQEDYNLAKRKMKADKVEYVPGVGIDVGKFKNTVVDRAIKRQELEIPKNAFLLISVGELNENKNHQIVIKAIAKLHNENVHYMIAGEGELKPYLENLARKLKVEKKIHFLGFRDDVEKLYKTSDAIVFPSIREGLGLAAIEGMAAGLPLICAKNRGTLSYAQNEWNAIVCNNIDEYVYAIKALYSDPFFRKKLKNNGEETAKKYDVRYINKYMHFLLLEKDSVR